MGVAKTGPTTSLPAETGFPLTQVITSPGFKPAASAGVPGSTWLIRTPWTTPRFLRAAGSGAARRSPMEPRGATGDVPGDAPGDDPGDAPAVEPSAARSGASIWLGCPATTFTCC